MNPNDRLIVALDVDSRTEALEFIKKLNDNHLIYYEPEMFKDTLVW